MSEALLASLPRDDERREAIRQILKTNLFALTRFLGYDLVCPEVHAEIIQCLTSPNKRKIIAVPRGTFKSTIGAITYPIFKLLNDPNERILIDSELYSNSVTYLRAIKHHLMDERMVELFGEFYTPTVWREDAILIKQRTANYKEPSISCGGIGTTKVGQHYATIIGDDYNSPDNTANNERAQRVIDHYRYNLNILEPEGEYLIIGTRYGANDIIGWILREVLNENDLSEGILSGHR